MKRASFVCVGIMLLVGGCGQTSAERIQAISKVASDANAASVQLGVELAQLKQQFSDLSYKLSDPNIDPAIQATLNSENMKVLAAIKTTTDKKAQADKIIAACADILAKAAKDPNIDITSELQTYGLIAQQTSTIIPAPYGTYVYLAGLLVAAVGGIVGASRQFQPAIAELQNNLTNVIQSVEAYKATTTDPKAVDAVLKANQPVETQAAVNQIKSDLKFAA